MNLLKKINSNLHFREMFKGSSIAIIFRLLSAVSSYFFTYFIVKLYGSVGFGIFSTSWTILMISTVIGKLGFDTSIVRFTAENVGVHGFKNMRVIYRRALKMVLASSALVTLIVIVFSKFLTKQFYDDLDTNTVVLLVALSIIPYALMSFNAETMKGMKKVIPFSIHNNVTVYFGMIFFTYLLHTFKPDSITTIISLFLIVFILMISSFLTLRFFLKYYPKTNSHYAEATPNKKTILKITLPMLLTNSIFLMMNWTDVLMLAYFKTQSEVGIYNTALKIAALNSILLIAINTIAMSKYAELFKTNKKAFKYVVKGVSTISFVFSLPIFLLILFFPQEILQLFDHDFTVAATALIILSFGQLYTSFSGSTVNLLNMVGKERTSVIIIVITFSINIILNYILIPVYGILGAAISTTFSVLLNNVISAIVIKKYIGFFPFPTFNIVQLKRLFKELLRK